MGEIINSKQITSIFPFEDGYAVFSQKVNKKELYGVINMQGEVVVEPQYVMAINWGKGEIAVSRRRYDGPFSSIYLNGEPQTFADAVADYKKEKESAEKEKGLPEAIAQMYDAVQYLGDDLFRVSKDIDGNRTDCGVIDINGTEITPIYYWKLERVGDYIVAYARSRNLRYGIMSLQGYTIIPFKYDYIEIFGLKDMNYIPVQKDDEWYYINLKNERVLL